AYYESKNKSVNVSEVLVEFAPDLQEALDENHEEISNHEAERPKAESFDTNFLSNFDAMTTKSQLAATSNAVLNDVNAVDIEDEPF
ncbi:unnamed protein product, partial [Agarophyton chilense]